jgi:hypothetical protein
MFVSDRGSYFSRFVIKFLEIFAAGLATAVSGYLIAQLSGAFPSSAPVPVGTVIQTTPSGTVSGSLPAQPAPVSADANEQRPAPQQEISGPVVTQPSPGTATATKADANEQHIAPQQREANAPVVAQPSPGTATATKADANEQHIAPQQQEANAPAVAQPVTAAKAVPARKHIETDTSAADSKRDQQSVLARARAALANSDAKRTKPSDLPTHQANAPRGPATIGQPSRPVDDRLGAGSIAAAPPDSSNLPPPMPQPPAEPTPLAPVEIESRPVVSVETVPAPPAQEETGVLSTLERLRHDPLADTDDTPRPPMPVGQ